MARGRKRTSTAKSFGEFKSRQKGVPANRNITKSTAGSGYQAGADSITNYSPRDQQTMFDAAGGKDKFIQQAIATQAKYPRGLDYQKFLDRAKQYQAGLLVGGKEVMGPDGIMRLQMAGADTPMRDAQGRQILSMMAPELTAQAPTMSQLFGDMGRGLGSIAGGLGEFIGGGGITGAILKAITGAKNVGKKGLDFLGQMFTRDPVSEVPMGPVATADDIAEAEVLAQMAGGSPTVDALSGKTYSELYGGDKDLSRFVIPTDPNAPNSLYQQYILSQMLEGDPQKYVDEDFMGENTLNYMDYDGRPFIKTNL